MDLTEYKAFEISVPASDVAFMKKLMKKLG